MEKISLIINTSKDGEEKTHKSFLKSLGIKSDCVGWCELDLTQTDAKEKIEEICKYAKDQHRSVRVWYEWKEDFEESEWYIYEPKDLSIDIEAWKEIKVPSKLHRDGWCYESVVDGINAYKIPKNVSIISFHRLKATSAIVSEEFRQCVENNGLTGMEFVWARDKGRYQAPDYYRAINVSAYDRNQIFMSRTESYEKIKKRKNYIYGPNWSWFAKFDLILQNIDIPPMFKGKTPQVDISEWDFGFIFSKKAANCLLEAKLISKSDLIPCEFGNEIPEYYEPITKYYGEDSGDEVDKLTEEEIAEIEKEHQKFSKKVRPVREVKQKDVLKEMKSKKRDNPEDFPKPLKKTVRETLVGTLFEPLLPYFSISDGLYSDEIEMFSYEEMKEATAEYLEYKAEEETLDLPDGIQIAGSAGGDYIIMTPDRVFRYSHEDWSIENEWDNVDLFVMEVLEEIE